jgi:hypothetical protein
LGEEILTGGNEENKDGFKENSVSSVNACSSSENTRT